MLWTDERISVKVDFGIEDCGVIGVIYELLCREAKYMRDDYESALDAQHGRIVILEEQLAAALVTIEAAAQPPEWCNDCGMPAEHCRENHATGHDYAEGCKP